jgi:hypothetical protein
MKILQMFPITVTITRLNITPSRILIGYIFIGIITESETCRIYELILLII